MKPPREILAIEDSEPFVDLLRAIFKRARIDHAPALALAFDRLAGHRYDLVILDLELLDARPEETIASIPEIRARCGLAKLVVLTGWEGYERDVRKHNVDVISKGDANLLLDVIDRVQPVKGFRPFAMVFAPVL